MNKWLVLGALALLAIWGALRKADPLATELPFGSTDLSSVESELAQLDPADRALIEAYVARSNGDYLPVGMGDPEDPLSARNFAEAIELQRRFEARMAVQDAAADERQAARDARFAPLRQMLALSWTDTYREDLSAAGSASAQKQASAGPPGERVVSVFRVRNLSDQTIAEFDASVDLRKDPRPATDLGMLGGCWITHREALRPGAEADIRCAANPELLSTPRSGVALIYEPKRILLSTGKQLEFRE